jgi:AcrR family transcriptional regulator
MTLPGDETRDRILAISRDLYLAHGSAGFSLREVARKARLTAPAVYRHFDSKDALLREVCSEGFRIFSSYLLRALSAATARERMAESAQQYLRFALDHPRYYRVIFMGASEDFAPMRPKRGNDPTFQFLIDRVIECQKERILPRGDPEAAATVIWSQVHGLVSLRLSGHLAGVGSDEEFRKFYLRAVLTPLTKEPT